MFVDLIVPGLVFPIINSLIMEPTGDFLPKSAPDAVRHVDYGLVIGSFFLAWFLGVVYVAKLSNRSDARTPCWSAWPARWSATL